MNHCYSREQVIEKYKQGLSLERADVRDLSLEHANFEGANLRRADLEGVNFEGSDLRKANLSYANLREAYLQRANLEGANLYKVDLEEANLEEANLQYADLSHANLAGARLERANLRGARLSFAQLELANLGKACLEEAQLDNVDLCEGYLGGARLIRANLQQANLAQVSFEQADLTGADIRACCLLEASLAGAVVTGCKLHGIQAIPEQLEHVLAEWVDFSPEGSGLVKVSGAELADYYRRSKEGWYGISPNISGQAKRSFGQGDVLRNASLEFGEDSQVEIEGSLENCAITLGSRTRLAVGPNGVLAGCKVMGKGEIIIYGQFYENGASPGFVGPGMLFVGKTGTVVAVVQQPETQTQFAFEHGCSLSLQIR